MTMISPPLRKEAAVATGPRKPRLVLIFTALILSLMGLSGQKAVAQGIPVNGGTLTYTVTQSTRSCYNYFGGNTLYYPYYDFYPITITVGGVAYPLGSAAYWQAIPHCKLAGSPSPVTFTYSPPSQQCTVNFVPAAGYASATGSCAPAYSGYVNPKYMVVGVTYAPLGPSGNTWVKYTNSSYVGSTNSLSQSFTTSTTYGISVQSGFGFRIFGVKAGGVDKNSWSTSNTQGSTSSTTVTTSLNVDTGETTYGTGNYLAPVDHDYDLIWIWLNPTVRFTVSGTSITWDGYGYDENDQNGMEVVPVALGYLNGDWGPISNWQYYPNSQRSWAAQHEDFPPGMSASLDSDDFAAIAAADPFSASTYGPEFITSSPPQQTSDGRYTFALCNGGNSLGYTQGLPGVPGQNNAPITQCDLSYTSLTTLANSTTTSTSQEFATDTQLDANFLGPFTIDLKSSHTLTWTTTAQQSITGGTTLTQALQDQGPPCNNQVPYQGPCQPIYGQSQDQPGEFFVYQDNVYGTFMLAPVNYFY